MDTDQIENAIKIAWQPQSDQSLRLQANLFVNQLRSNTSAWQACLPLFIRDPPSADEIRHFCLEIITNCAIAPEVDGASKQYMKTTLSEYVVARYSGPTSPDTNHIQNKLAQCLTSLFVQLYASQWATIFDDFLGLAGGDNIGQESTLAGTMLYLRLLGSISDEIADVFIPRTPEEGKRNQELKDAIRVRDSQKIALSWQRLLERRQQLPTDVVDLCLKTISRWAPWIDIGLVANPAVVQPLLQLASQQNYDQQPGSQVNLRNGAIDAFTEIAGKKMRPQEKVELIKFLELDSVLAQLVSSTALSADRKTPRYDVDLAECVAQLVNIVTRDIVIVLESSAPDAVKQQADTILLEFVPYLLRFFADEYDEVCVTMIESLTELLSYFRKTVKALNSLPSQYTPLLTPILEAIIAKMKFDETTEWGDEGEELDQEEFEQLREKLAVLQSNVAAVDESLYMDTLSRLVVNTFQLVDASSGDVEWQQLDLALHEMYLFGDLATKNKGLYQKKQPSNEASRRLVEMMAKMLSSNIAAHAHPAIQLQYIELCVRYCSFFDENPDYIPSVLDNFVRYMHSSNEKVRARAWYLFLRFTKTVRNRLADISLDIIKAISDLLIIKASVTDADTDGRDDGDDTETSTGSTEDRTFNAQLNIFEAVGYITSAPSIAVTTKAMYAQSVLQALLSDMTQQVPAAKNGDDRAMLQIHHDIVALGAFARGLSDWVPGNKAGNPPPAEVSGKFASAAEVVMATLEALNSSALIREAARFTLARLIGVLGPAILKDIPRWINGLLSEKASRDEMATFLKLFEQMIFSFKKEILRTVDVVLGPLSERIFARLQGQPRGTDEEHDMNDLKREFLSFILQVLTQDLAEALISPTNQARLDPLISALEVFGRDGSDYNTSRLVFTIFTRMTSVWGGPDIPSDGSQPPAPSIPGFDTFAVVRFSPLSWAIPSDPNFRVRDPTARNLVHEIAQMQQEILKKTGGMYVEALGQELRGMGMSEMETEGYLGKLRGDPKAFKDFLVGFLGRGQE